MSSSDKPVLKVAPCSHDAAKYAVENWHYSKRMPKSKLVKFGVWENSSFVGCIIYGAGAAPEIGSPYGLAQTEVCELVRVAFKKHRTPVTRCIAISSKMLKKSMQGVRLIVSFADSSQGHHGGIYQGGGWIYTGSTEYHAYMVKGELHHPRSLGLRYGVGGQSIPWLRANVDPNAQRIANGVKHKYVMPLDADIRERIIPLSKPYPKRAGSSSVEHPTSGGEAGGSTPTPALKNLVPIP